MPAQRFIFPPLFLLLLAGCVAHPLAHADDIAAIINAEQPTEAGFQRWLADFAQQAQAEGISAATVSSALQDIRLNPEVLKRDAFQPEFVKPVWDYLSTAVSELRVANGQAKYAEHRQLLEVISAKYQVNPTILVGIWGLETAYGHTFGGFNVIEALATLSYTGRRQSYAQPQLLAALRIIDAKQVPADQMFGSWAGAMGHTQFIPTSYELRALDEDGDGKRDIWNSLPDVFASTANYLAKVGWQFEQDWGLPVHLPSNFDWSLADPEAKRSIAEWQGLGVQATDWRMMPTNTEQDAVILLPAGHQGPAFLVLSNFRAILRYNNSTAYALAIGLLADQIGGKSAPELVWPEHVEALTRDERQQLQQALTAAGYDTGGVDGIIGANSRKALRAWQTTQGLPADGFPTKAQLLRLMQ